MIYYRAHADLATRRPPELVDWVSPSVDATLNETIIGVDRVMAITPQFVFAPPEGPWEPLGDSGWFFCQSGAFDLMAHARIACKYQCIVQQIAGMSFILPVITTPTGERAFPVSYGGPDFMPQLTAEQESDLALAIEIRTCISSGNIPAMNRRAKWAARFLTRTYNLSLETIGATGLLTDDLIIAIELAAGGLHGIQAS